MKLPGFNGQASLYRTIGRYRASSSDFGSLPTNEPADPVPFNWTEKPDSVTSWSNILAHFNWDIGSDIAWSTCNAAGRPCCGPDAGVKTPHCHRGLGCNIATGLCEACGGPGQVCCDGHFTGFSLKGYTGIILDPAERIESCNPGTRCDAQLAADGVKLVAITLVTPVAHLITDTHSVVASVMPERAIGLPVVIRGLVQLGNA